MAGDGLRVLCSAEVVTDDLTGPRPPSPHTASFYADPVAWLVVDAVEAALRLSADDDIRSAATDVAVLSVSAEATGHTMRQLAATSCRGRVSPMRFAGASAGSIAGLSCIMFGFKGPSLVLSMPPADGRPVAEIVARSWLTAGNCRYVVLNEHEIRSGTTHSVRSSIVDQQNA
jgi:hypothetical protein